MSEPQGQDCTGTPMASVPNTKTQGPSNDGSGGPTGWGPVSSQNMGAGPGSEQNPGVVNPYVTADSNAVPATRSVSANRIQQIDPGAQTLGDC